jgi:hypothetical protein
MKQGLYTFEEVTAMIREGKKLLLAGDYDLLSQLPQGDWIAGTTPYFILYPEQRLTSYDRIFVYCLPDFVEKTVIREYDASDIKGIYNDAPQNAFTVVIIPFGSAVAQEYSMNAPYYDNFARRPVCGWISGRPLDTLMTGKSYAGAGATAAFFTDKAVAMHISLPADKYAEIHIFNPFKQGSGDTITFDYSSQIVKDAIINGQRRNFAGYLHEKNINLELPLVANYSGAMMNINCYEVKDDEVYLSAPVFENVNYRFAGIDLSVSEPELISERIVLSVTCITNYLQPELCRKYIKKLNGPVVYGEIAYQLVNQTTVYVTIDSAAQ